MPKQAVSIQARVRSASAPRGRGASAAPAAMASPEGKTGVLLDLTGYQRVELTPGLRELQQLLLPV